MTKFAIVVSVILLMASNGICGTFLEAFDAGAINEDMWTVIADTDGKVTVENEQLKIVGAGGDKWNVTGVRFNQPINISEEKLTVECDALPGGEEFLLAFTTSITAGDPWDAESYWSWLVMDSLWQWESNAQGAKASIKKPFQFPVDLDKWYHFKVEIIPTGNKSTYETNTSVNNGDAGDAETDLDIAGADPSEVYVHLCAGYHAFTEPVLVDNFTITADSIEGNLSVEYQGKLSTTWGELKRQ